MDDLIGTAKPFISDAAKISNIRCYFYPLFPARISIETRPFPFLDSFLLFFLSCVRSPLLPNRIENLKTS